MVLPRDAKSSMMLRPLTKNDTVPSPQFHLRQKVSASELSATQQQQATAANGLGWGIGVSWHRTIGWPQENRTQAARTIEGSEGRSIFPEGAPVD